MRKFYILKCLFLFCVAGYAQDSLQVDLPTSININSNRRLHNEIGIDIAPLNFLLNRYSTGTPSLFYRKHYLKEKKTNSPGVTIPVYKAWRIRVGSNLNFSNIKYPEIQRNYTGNYYNNYFPVNESINSSFFIRVGNETQKRYRRFELIYGYDFFLYYSKDKYYYFDISYYNAGTASAYTYNRETKRKTSTINFGIGGIGGFKYFLTPRLCFSAEATINAGYEIYDYKNEANTYDGQTNTYNTDLISYKRYSFDLFINPLYVVNMGFYF